MITNCLVGVLLLIYSIQDIKTKSVSRWLLLLGAIILTISAVLHTDYTFFEIVIGVLLGASLYLFSKILRGQIGSGDGVIVAITGIGLGIWNNLGMLFCALFLAGIFSAILLITGKKRNYQFPFVPFLLAGFICLFLIGGTA